MATVITAPPTEVTLPPAAGSQPVLYRFTPEQYLRLCETEIIPQDERIELLEGVVTRMSPVGDSHAIAVTVLHEVLFRLLPAGWHIRCQQPLRLSTSMPQPDLAVIRGLAREFTLRRQQPQNVGLLVEVADSALNFDRTEKRRIYAQAGIAIYWIVNLNENCVEVHSSPVPASETVPAEYSQVRICRNGDQIPFVLDAKEVARIPAVDVLP